MKLSARNNKIQTTARPQSPQVAGIIQTYAGANAPSGWALCDGTILEQADYPDLFAALGSTWDSFAHPVDGTPTVGASQFALPNLKGLYLAGAGDAGGDDRTLGVFQDDGTAVNGVSDSGHQHQMIGNNPGSGSISVPTWTFAGSTTGLSAQTGGNQANLTSSDSETRPKTAPITYIIKLYSDTTSAVSVGINEATAAEAGVVKKPGGSFVFTNVDSSNRGGSSSGEDYIISIKDLQSATGTGINLVPQTATTASYFDVTESGLYSINILLRSPTDNADYGISKNAKGSLDPNGSGPDTTSTLFDKLSSVVGYENTLTQAGEQQINRGVNLTAVANLNKGDRVRIHATNDVASGDNTFARIEQIFKTTDYT